MTTIAWDGVSLAADRYISAGGDIVGQAVKIRRCKDGRLIGVAGNFGFMAAFLDWLEFGGEDRPVFPTQLDEALEILPNGKVYNHLHSGRALLASKHNALGTGTSYALAAMACGKDAAGAVKIATMFDGCSGGKIDVLRLKEKPRAK